MFKVAHLKLLNNKLFAYVDLLSSGQVNYLLLRIVFNHVSIVPILYLRIKQ